MLRDQYPLLLPGLSEGHTTILALHGDILIALEQRIERMAPTCKKEKHAFRRKACCVVVVVRGVAARCGSFAGAGGVAARWEFVRSRRLSQECGESLRVVLVLMRSV